MSMSSTSSCTMTAPGSWTYSQSAYVGRTIGKIPFFMLDINVDTPALYLTGTDRTIIYESNTYSPFPFSVEPVKNVVGPSPISLRIATSNIDRSIATIVLSASVQGKEIVVRKAYWTEADPSVCTSPYVYYRGLIDTVVIREDQDTASVEFELKNDFVRWDSPIPRNTFGASCQWIFKSSTPGCQYTGVATYCDRSYERCLTLGNSERFRGFRHMHVLEDYQIWWGKTRETSDEP